VWNRHGGDFWAATLDLKGWFHQFALAPSVMRLFGPKSADGKMFGLGRMAQGFSWSSWIAHSTGEHLISQAGIAQHSEDLVCALWIDNVCLCGKRGEVERALKRLIAVFDKFGVGYHKVQQGLHVDFLNLDFNFEKGFYHFNEAKLGRMDDILGKWIDALPKGSNNATWDLEEVQRFVGNLVWLHYVKAHPLGFLQIRESLALLSGLTREGESPLNTTALRVEWERSRSWLLQPWRLRWRQPERTAVLFTDASLSGWGATLWDGTKQTELGGMWDQRVRHINWLELKAALIGLAWAGRRIPNPARCQLVHVLDSSVALGMIRRKYSPMESYQGLLTATLQSAAQFGLHSPLWAPSGLNLADGPSRGKIPGR
jgi:hypothetical protein